MEKARLFSENDNSLIGLIERTLTTNWDRTAYSDYGTAVNYTYGDVANDIARLHLLYKELGIKKGDKIALCDKNSTHWAVAFLSIVTYGAVAVPILADFSVEQVRNIVSHSESALLIAGKDSFDFKKTLNIATWRFFQDADSYAATYEAMDKVSVGRDAVRYDHEDPESLAIISYTSGSTGRSKGVMLPYRSIWSNVIFADQVIGAQPGYKTMAILPMAHMYSFAFDFIYEFCVGCHVHFLTKVPSPHIVIKAFNEVKPIIVISVPLIIEKIVTGRIFPVLRKPAFKVMLKFPILKQFVYWRIRSILTKAFGGNFYEVIIGGAAFSKEVEDFLHKIHFKYTVGYGMTECGPILAYEDYKKFVKGSCGKAAPRMELRILSDDPQNTPGEIIAKGMNVMLGYYKNEEETAAAIDSEGWLHTGDLGTIDKNGNLFIRGRKKTMLLGANGQNIYPEEVEDVINSLEYFDECVIVQRGEKLVALTYTSDKSLAAKELTKEAFMQNLTRYRNDINARLPKFANITDIEVMDKEFEKTPKHSIRRFLYK